MTGNSRRMFKCTHAGCKAEYTRQFRLNKHIQFHTGERQRSFICTHASCTKSFYSLDDRRLHELIHTQSKQHKCLACGREFLRKCTLLRHNRNVRCHNTIGNTDETSQHLSRAAVLEDVELTLQQDTLFDRRIAPLSNHQPLYTLALEIHADPSEEQTRQAVRNDTWPLLLRKGQYSLSWYRQVWFIAAEVGSVSLLSHLHQTAKVEINTIRYNVLEEQTALQLTAKYGNHGALSELLKLGAEVDLRATLKHPTPLHMAVYYGNVQCALTLIDNGADVDVFWEGPSALMRIPLQRSSSTDLFRAALDKTKDIRAADEYGDVLLHYAAGNPDPTFLSLTLAYGADIHARDSYGHTVLHVACSYLNLECLKIILQKGDLVHSLDTCGRTALHRLGFRADEPSIEATQKIVEALCQHGADINARDEDGDTPLMEWIRLYSSDDSFSSQLRNKVLCILQHDPDVNVISSDGQTALDMILEILEAEKSAPELEDLALILAELYKRGAQRAPELQASPSPSDEDEAISD